jgi:hypothetical protein
MNGFKRHLATKTSPQLESKAQLDRKSIMFIEDVAAVLRSHYTDNSAEYCRSTSSPAAMKSSGNNALPSSEKSQSIRFKRLYGKRESLHRDQRHQVESR